MSGITDLISENYEYENFPTKRNEVEFLGVRILEEFFSKELNWVFIENHQENDYGIDAFVEEVINNKVTGRMIGLQIKTGKSYVKRNSNDEIVYSGDLKHLNYWTNHSLPIILVLCDPDTGICYWKLIIEEDIKKTQKGWTLKIETSSQLSLDSINDLKEIAQKPQYQKRLDELVFAKPWMDEILKGNKIILEAEEWVNKTDGRGSIKVLLDDHLEKNEVKLVSAIRVPFADYSKLFQTLFPWAKIMVDEDYYYEYEYESFFADNSHKDEDTGEWCENPEFEEDFEVYREGLNPIRSYEIESGELAKYRLTLSINEFGKSFYNVDSYLRNENNLLFEMVDKTDIERKTYSKKREDEILFDELAGNLKALKEFRYLYHLGLVSQKEKKRELYSLLNKFEKSLKTCYEYCEWYYTYTSNIFLTYLDRQTLEFLLCLKEKVEFSEYFIENELIDKLYGSGERLVSLRNDLVKLSEEIYYYKSESAINYIKENKVKATLEEEYWKINKEYSNNVHFDKFINEYLSIERDSQELNSIKLERNLLMEKDNTIGIKLKETLFEFLKIYLERLLD